jgi:hypothetical protein
MKSNLKTGRKHYFKDVFSLEISCNLSIEFLKPLDQLMISCRENLLCIAYVDQK